MKQNKVFSGFYSRHGEKLYVGDKVETVQGTVFEIIKFEHFTGTKYLLHDGNKPYALEHWMSPNLWLL